MIYLLSQMLLLIAVAAVLGGAIAWLFLRVRNNARLETVRQALAQRTRQLEQARTDVALLNEDYEDLRLSSRDRIDELSTENREIPALTRNLEKSQLLVRQMIQRHEAEIRELIAEKTVLGDRLRTLQERIRAREDVSRSGLLAPTEAATLDTTGFESRAVTGSVTPATTTDTSQQNPSHRGWGSQRLSDVHDDSLDEVMEVGDELAAELREDDSELDADSTLALEQDASDLDASDLADLDAQPLFEPVERQDDLQQIFGIGPLTEKALNDLGITSYPQLAELERFEIEKIADALEIVPETIVRDDWVGNARKQLEEVLEEL